MAKYNWWYCATNGMIDLYRNCPGPNWIGPYDSQKDAQNANKPYVWRCQECGRLLWSNENPKCPCTLEGVSDD